MARVPDQRQMQLTPEKRKAWKGIVKPAGKFIRGRRIHVTTHRSPENVTRINPDDMKPILPEMIYIPPQ